MKIDEIVNVVNSYEKDLSPYATNDSSSIRFIPIENDIRSAFFRDIDRVIYSLSYTRYIDKTQVFSLNNNDHLSKRIIHVQLVSKIARTIGRVLKLNEDLIEAIALGHDLGHVPFGHVGERILNDISLKYDNTFFNHNIQSVRVLKDLENNGKGSNVSLQVLDGIMCHNGELELACYEPVEKSLDKFMEEYLSSYTDKSVNIHLKPMTLEGCVVRISDIIGYIGRDIEDAIRLSLLSINDVPLEFREFLGTTNKEIVNSFILDIIENSYGKPYIKMSSKMFEMLKGLKKFNYEYIYLKANSDEMLQYYDEVFNTVFHYNLDNINNLNGKIYSNYLVDMTDDYNSETSDVRKVIDYISGMTDDYIISEYNEILNEIKVK